MAVYDPPQLFGSDPLPDTIPGGGHPTAGFSLTGWRAVGAFVAIVAYFVILGRTGGTVFQRLGGMERAR